MTAKLTLSTTLFVMVTDKVLRLYNVMELGSKINVNYPVEIVWPVRLREWGI